MRRRDPERTFVPVTLSGRSLCSRRAAKPVAQIGWSGRTASRARAWSSRPHPRRGRRDAGGAEPRGGCRSPHSGALGRAVPHIQRVLRDSAKEVVAGQARRRPKACNCFAAVLIPGLGGRRAPTGASRCDSLRRSERPDRHEGRTRMRLNHEVLHRRTSRPRCLACSARWDPTVRHRRVPRSTR